MTSFNQLREKLIIIGESREDERARIESRLSAAGFRNVVSVASARDALERPELGPDRADEVGVILIGGDAWDFGTAECCESVAAPDCGAGVPVIVFTDALSDPHNSPAGVTVVDRAIRAGDFMALLRLSLMLRAEWCRRRSQEERLLSELAGRKIIEARYKYLIAHDELTGLANRRSIEKHLELAVHRCRNLGQEGALLYLDLDRFNFINDKEGHKTGDRLLVEVVGVLHGALPADHLSARIGADEFCIFLERATPREALAVAERLRQALEGLHFVTGTDSYHISASIGVALLEAKNPVAHPAALIAQAHQACYVAKSSGRNTVHLYSEQDADAHERRSDILWVPLIREALLENRFFMVFQPVVRVADGAVCHYEVLIRMKGKGGEVFLPGEFIPVAERMGLIHRIDLWVVESAMDFLASMPEDQSHVNLTINLSGVAFQDPSLLPLIRRKLAMTGLAASRITFEITETATVANFQQTREMITRIRALGFRFALDDFGAGFSSFDYIKQFPVDYLKIDGQFIQHLHDDETDQVLVKAMIEIARKLGKRTIAEYVETPTVLQLLQRFGIDYVQGYLIGKPEPHLLPIPSVPLGGPAQPATAGRTL